jgi:hypothetical protein
MASSNASAEAATGRRTPSGVMATSTPCSVQASTATAS